MFAGRKNLIRPVGSLDMIPTPIFFTIFFRESLKKYERPKSASERAKMVDRLKVKHIFSVEHTCVLNVFRGSVTPEVGALVNDRFSNLTIF